MQYCNCITILNEKHDEFMLQDLMTRWANHKVMIKCQRSFIPWITISLFGGHFLHLKKYGLNCFRELAYQDLHNIGNDATIYSSKT